MASLDFLDGIQRHYSLLRPHPQRCQLQYRRKLKFYSQLKFVFSSPSTNSFIKSGFHYTADATTTTQKQSDYKVEQSSFLLIALF